jgi:hypothetical protein
MSTTITTVTPLVPPLEGSSNYESWARDVKMLLIGEDLWDHVDMEPATDAAASVKKAAQKAMAKIYMLLGPGAKMEVTECETAKAMWDRLKKTYESRGLNRQVALLNELFDLNLQDCRDMEEYILKFTTIDAKLKSIDKRMDDQILAVLMLRGLTPDYRPFRMALENTVPTSATGERVALNMEMVKARLLEEGRTRTLEQTRAESGVVFAVKHKQKHGSAGASTTRIAEKKSKFVFDPKKARCFRCKEIGHIKSECPLHPSGNVASEYNSKSRTTGDKVNWLTLMKCDVKNDEWYLDSACNGHTTINDQGMYGYQTSNDSASTANNAKIGICGIGSVTLATTQGGKINLTKVHHAPDIAANLLSVSRIAKAGTSLLFDGHGCTMYETSSLSVQGIVQATATEKNGLYALDLRTTNVNDPEEQTDEKVTYAINIANESAQMLWHKRLGHLGYRNMQLVKDLADGVNFPKNSKLQSCVACIEGLRNHSQQDRMLAKRRRNWN